MSVSELLDGPVFFDSTRVWRCYLGGKLLDEFVGNERPDDGYFPEDWLASVTRAENGAQQQSPDEGLSRIRGSDLLFSELLARHPDEALGPHHGQGLGVLCKFLDSAIRLPIQCHPDRAFAREHFHSEHGKTESWLILGTRRIRGEDPYILMGFRSDTTPERFRQAVLAQDVRAMVGCLNKFPVSPGDAYIIHGRVPHAIGPGVLLLEVQEPTDLVIQPERSIGEVTLSEEQMWAGLDHDTAFACFDYRGQSPEATLSRLRLASKEKGVFGTARLDGIIGSEQTDCFRLDRLTVSGEFELAYDAPWYLGIVTSGSGVILGTGGAPLRQGDRFFVSNRIGSLRYRPEGGVPLVLYLVTAGN
jgi:mannose-6-phosphate isomerase